MAGVYTLVIVVFLKLSLTQSLSSCHRNSDYSRPSLQRYAAIVKNTPQSWSYPADQLHQDICKPILLAANQNFKGSIPVEVHNSTNWQPIYKTYLSRKYTQFVDFELYSGDSGWEVCGCFNANKSTLYCVSDETGAICSDPRCPYLTVLPAYMGFTVYYSDSGTYWYIVANPNLFVLGPYPKPIDPIEVTDDVTNSHFSSSAYKKSLYLFFQSLNCTSVLNWIEHSDDHVTPFQEFQLLFSFLNEFLLNHIFSALIFVLSFIFLTVCTCMSRQDNTVLHIRSGTPSGNGASDRSDAESTGSSVSRKDCGLEVDTGLASEVARVLEDSSVTENSSTLSDCNSSSDFINIRPRKPFTRRKAKRRTVYARKCPLIRGLPLPERVSQTGPDTSVILTHHGVNVNPDILSQDTESDLDMSDAASYPVLEQHCPSPPKYLHPSNVVYEEITARRDSPSPRPDPIGF